MEFKPSISQIRRHTLNKFVALLSLAILISCNSSFAQNYTTSDKKAIKLYKEAQEFSKQFKLKEMENNLLESIERDPQFIEAQTLLAYCYLDQGNYIQAKTKFKDAIAINSGKIPNNLFFLAELELNDGEYEEAKKHFNQFLGFNPKDPSITERTNKGLDIIHFSLQLKANPVPFDPVNLGANINTELNEYFPCLTVDGSTILFTRRLPHPEAPQGFNEDFYTSISTEGTWSPSANIKDPINTLFNEGAPSLAADGQLLFFTACELFGDYGGERKGYGSCDIFYTLKGSQNWTKPRNLGKTVNTQHWETQPSFSADGKTLYFIRGKRTRSGVRRGDIYTTVLGKDGYWTNPIPLGPQINTTGNEESVFIHPDGKTLYFSSDGHLGMGGLDIFKSTLQEDGKWSQPINLGYPINTHKSENSLLVGASGKLAYFASDRPNGFGGLDLYQFELPNHLKPNPVNYFAGKIFDKETKKPLSARFELIDLKTGEIIIESYSNPGNGGFLVTLPSGKDYALNASLDGYLFYSENFSFEKSKNNEPVKKDIPLLAIKVGEAIVLKNIFFETNQFNLKDKSKVELEKLVDFLKKNTNIKIEISGHTDSIGSNESNRTLSKNRANSVVDYLIKNEIEKDRISSRGYGSSKPIDSNDTETGRANNRRTEFKITGI